MADQVEAPLVKDLPKLDEHIKGEIVKDVQLKHIEVRHDLKSPNVPKPTGLHLFQC